MMLTKVVSIAGLLALAVPALAQDYGSMPCEDLWYSRNAFYKEAGYCFKTARAIRAFGNAGCLYDEMGAVPLSQAARRDIADIQYWERRRGCPR
jgi:hypothetical protein